MDEKRVPCQTCESSGLQNRTKDGKTVDLEPLKKATRDLQGSNFKDHSGQKTLAEYNETLDQVIDELCDYENSTYWDAYWGSGKSEVWRIVFLRAITDFLAICALYFAIDLLTVAEASAIFFQYNMFVFIGASIATEQKTSCFAWCCCFISVCGTLVICKYPPALFPNAEVMEASVYTFAGSRTCGVLSALLGALCLSISIVSIDLSKQVHWIQMEQAAGATNTCLVAPIMIILCKIGAMSAGTTSNDKVFIMLDSRETGICILLGVLGFLALMFMVQGYQGIESGPGTIIAYLELPLTFVFQGLILGYFPDPTIWYGGILILIAAVSQTLYIWCTERSTQQEHAGYNVIPSTEEYDDQDDMSETSRGTGSVISGAYGAGKMGVTWQGQQASMKYRTDQYQQNGQPPPNAEISTVPEVNEPNSSRDSTQTRDSTRDEDDIPDEENGLANPGETDC